MRKNIHKEEWSFPSPRVPSGASQLRHRQRRSKRPVSRPQYRVEAEAIESRLLLDGLNFAAGVPYPTGGSPQCVTAVDVNGDGNWDLATANGNSPKKVPPLLLQPPTFFCADYTLVGPTNSNLGTLLPSISTDSSNIFRGLAQRP